MRLSYLLGTDAWFTWFHVGRWDSSAATPFPMAYVWAFFSADLMRRVASHLCTISVTATGELPPRPARRNGRSRAIQAFVGMPEHRRNWVVLSEAKAAQHPPALAFPLLNERCLRKRYLDWSGELQGDGQIVGHRFGIARMREGDVRRFPARLWCPQQTRAKRSERLLARDARQENAVIVEWDRTTKDERDGPKAGRVNRSF